MSKTVSQIVEEYINRKNPKIRTIIIELSNRDRTTCTYYNVSNLHDEKDELGLWHVFDTPDRHIRCLGHIVMKEEYL